MTTISSSTTAGIYLTSASYSNPIVVNSGVTVANTGTVNHGDAVVAANEASPQTDEACRRVDGS
jgi:hypothetical protein